MEDLFRQLGGILILLMLETIDLTVEEDYGSIAENGRKPHLKK